MVKKITERKPNESRRFMFTDKEVRNYDYNLNAKAYSDLGCKRLRISISETGNHTYMYQDAKYSKVIGSIYLVSVKQARDIVNNIRENYEEFAQDIDNIKINLAGYFLKNGFYPHKKVEEVHNESYDNVIKKLLEDNQKLIEEVKTWKSQVQYLSDKLLKIRDIAQHTELTEK